MGLLSLLGIGKDIKDSTDGIGNNVAKIISVARGKLPPEQQVEVEKIRAEVDVKLDEIRAKSEGVLRDFIIKYEGSADQIPKWLLVWRSVIRPVFTTFVFLQFTAITTVSVMQVVLYQIPLQDLLVAHMPRAWWWIVGIVVMFWFGGHGIERAVEKLNGRKK